MMKLACPTVVPMVSLRFLVLNFLVHSHFSCFVEGGQYRFDISYQGNPWGAEKGSTWPKTRNTKQQATHDSNKRIYPYFIITASGLVLVCLVVLTIFHCRNKARTEKEVPPMESALEEDGELMEEEAAMVGVKEMVEIGTEEYKYGI
eukprot:scaffold1953_cov176-Amphora_coffeaeformis.AAC.9